MNRTYIFNLIEEERWEDLLRNLLAVIHRDGGHYTELVGIVTSVEEACNVQYAHWQEIADLKRKLKPSKD